MIPTLLVKLPARGAEQFFFCRSNRYFRFQNTIFQKCTFLWAFEPLSIENVVDVETFREAGKVDVFDLRTGLGCTRMGNAQSGGKLLLWCTGARSVGLASSKEHLERARGKGRNAESTTLL